MTAVGGTADAFSELEHRVQLRRAVIASTIGTTIEWYDFFLYSTVTGLVFAKLYFPESDPLVGTLQAFGIYAVGFVARPVGAAIFGHYDDRIGRKAALIATLLLMGIATFLVAFVPTYVQIGIWGAIILTILRFIQGVGVGGEWSGSVLHSMEWARSDHHRGFIAAGRNSACQPGCSWRIWRRLHSAKSPAASFSTGDGASRSSSASSLSGSGFTSGSAFSRRQPLHDWWPRTGSRRRRPSR